MRPRALSALSIFGILVAACSSLTESSDGMRPIVFVRIAHNPESNVSGAYALYQVRLDGQPPLLIDLPVVDPVHPAVSPDGTQLAFWSLGSGLTVLSLDDGTLRTIDPGAPFLGLDRMGWSPSADRLVLGVTTVSYGSSLLILSLGDGTSREIGPGFRSPSWAADGSILVASGPGTEPRGLYRLDPAGGAPEVVVLPDSAPITDASFSPDGSELVFVRGVPQSLIHVARADGSSAHAITRVDSVLQNRDRRPVWSRDGRWIAFEREATRCDSNHVCRIRYDICVMRSDGTQLRNLTSGTPGGREPTW